MACTGCVCVDNCDYKHELDWDTRVELLEIELEALRKEIQAIRDKFDKLTEKL
jgi:chaperonin cofactor prefoldin